MVVVLVNFQTATREVNSPFSSSSSEEGVQPEPDRSRNRIRWTLPKCANRDFELGWTEQIQTVQKPAFSGIPGINKNFHTTQDTCPWDIFEIFLSPEMFKIILKETDRYATQQINKIKKESPLTPKSVFAQRNTVSWQEIKNYFVIFIHMSTLQTSLLQDYWSLLPIIQTPYAASVGMCQDRFLMLLTMFHLKNDAKAARGQPGKMWLVIETLITKFQMSTHWKNS